MRACLILSPNLVIRCQLAAMRVHRCAGEMLPLSYWAKIRVPIG